MRAHRYQAARPVLAKLIPGLREVDDAEVVDQIGGRWILVVDPKVTSAAAALGELRWSR